ncbi:MAG: SLC13 family permease [Helcococcus sp.]|nr:SLC13 family permease [Helcococcus sp.]
MNQKIKNSKLIFTIIGLLIYSISWGNQLFNWNILNISSEAFSAISIFFASILLWIFVATDWPSLLAILAIGMIPSIGFSKALQLSFGNQTFIFLLFTFVVTYALNQTSLLKRVSFNLLNSKLAKSSGYGFIISLLLVVLFISSIMSPTVIFMFFFPIYEELVQQFGWKKGDKSASILLFAMFTTIAIGTAMTPINHVFSVTAMSIFKESANIEITNYQYMMLGIPSGIIIFAFLLLFIRKIDFSNIKNVNLKTIAINKKMNKREKIIITIFFIMIALWIVPEMFISIFPSFAKFIKTNGLAFAPLFATIILLILKIDNKPLLNISDAISKGVHWPSLLLVSATLLLGSTISNQDIGVVKIIQDNVTPIIKNASPMLIVLIFTLIAGLFTNFTSNLVTVSFVSTILMTLKPSGVEIATLISMIGFASSLAMMTAPSMPYVAVSIGSEWTNAKDCIKYGGVFLIISTIILVLVTYSIGKIVF